MVGRALVIRHRNQMPRCNILECRSFYLYAERAYMIERRRRRVATDCEPAALDPAVVAAGW